MSSRKESFKKTLEEMRQLANRKLAPKIRKHEGPGREKRLIGKETVDKIGREFQELKEKEDDI